MKKIQELNIQTWPQKERRNASYFKEDFAIFEVSKTSISNYPIKSKIYGFCLCLKGKSYGTIDLIPYELSKGKVSVNVPGQLITSDSVSEDFMGICILMSSRFVEGLGLPYDFDLYDVVKESPIISLSDKQSEALHTYCKMVKGLLEKQRLFQAETLKHLTCAHFYGLRAYLYQMPANKILSNNELLVKRFINEVRKHYSKERKVSFYAEKLCVSSGYLSTVITNATGKNASEWIENFVILEAKALLKSTNLTIQQVCDSLHFPSQSFFGKYFKRITGKSPKEYREDKG